MSLSPAGSLYVVATPIGNLKDITLRAIEILQQVDLIAAEDTRYSKRLLNEYDISKPMLALHEHNEQEQVQQLLSLLESGKKVALISDAGTPLISDPGFPLIRAVRAAGIKIYTVPGACAAIAALSISGLPTDHFVFEGFLPSKSQARSRRLELLEYEKRTLVFYESVHRIVESLQDMGKVFGSQRRIVVARELTKTYETVLTGELSQVLQQIQADNKQQLGEFVVLVQGYQLPKDELITTDAKQVLKILLAELPLKQAVQLAAKITNNKRNDLYDYAINLSKGLNHE